MAGRKWTSKDEETLIGLYKQNVKIEDIASQIGRTPASVNKKIISLGINIQYQEFRKENVIGMKSGKLTVIEDLGVFKKDGNQKPHHYVKCQCGCEHQTILSMQLNNFKTGRTTSCPKCKPPHANFKDLTGQVFSHLTVIKRLPDHITPRGTRKVVYLCRCDCPGHNEVAVWASNLKHGSKTLSCGCHKKKISQINGKNTKIFNKYHVIDDTVFVKYSNCNQWFLCDLEDWKYLKWFTWSKNTGKDYATTIINNKTYMMHKVIIDCCPDNMFVDHEFQVVNGVLDNRKKNLRLANGRQNAMNHVKAKNNKSGYIGVQYEMQSDTWKVTINLKANKQSSYSGFATKEEALIKRLQLEHDNYGIFSPQRWMFQIYNIDDSDLDYESVRFSNKKVQEQYGYSPGSMPLELVKYKEEIKQCSNQTTKN